MYCSVNRKYICLIIEPVDTSLFKLWCWWL